MEEDWLSAYHFWNFPRQKKVFCVGSKMQILHFARQKWYLHSNWRLEKIHRYSFIKIVNINLLVKVLSANTLWWWNIPAMKVLWPNWSLSQNWLTNIHYASSAWCWSLTLMALLCLIIGRKFAAGSICCHHSLRCGPPASIP